LDGEYQDRTSRITFGLKSLQSNSTTVQLQIETYSNLMLKELKHCEG